MSALKLDPELLEAFVAVADRLSFTRAATYLNRSQAAVSLQVKRLEARLGLILFVRSTSRVGLTSAGREFLADARRLISLHNEISSKLAGGQDAGHMRIGVMEDYGTKRLPQVLCEVVERFPRMEIEMEIGLTANMLARTGTSFDVVIAMHPLGSTDGELICEEEPVWIGAPRYEVGGSGILPLALSGRDCLFRQWASRALDEAGIAWRLAYVSTSQAAVEAIVTQGLAATVAKKSMIPKTLKELDCAKMLPVLPGAEIRFHRAASLTGVTAAFADNLAHRLKVASI
ncbi:LysR family transcriptional regulator [Phyllobacterium sp. K27]